MSESDSSKVYLLIPEKYRRGNTNAQHAAGGTFQVKGRVDDRLHNRLGSHRLVRFLIPGWLHEGNEEAMSILVPWTDADKVLQVRRAIITNGYKPMPFRMNGDHDYFDFLSMAWDRWSTFTVIEHDVIVGDHTLSGFDTCPEPWCSAPIEYLGGSYHGLGCVRFRYQLMEQHPDVFDRVGTLGDGTATHPPRHWCALDSRLTAVLRSKGISKCEHNTEVLKHLGHDGHSNHGCI